MRSLLISIVCVVSLYGVDFVELYRFKGIDAVERELAKSLEERSYWKSFFEGRDVRFGYYESSENILVANKSIPNLILYKKRDGKFEKVSSIDAFVGESAGAKRKEGDLKTPVGVYDLTRKLTTVEPFYGPMAFVTSYPNLLDKLYERDGHGIWIHGLPLSGDRPKYTQGCIAIANDYLVGLDQDIEHEKSTLIIWEEEPREVRVEDIEMIMASIYRWRKAWKFNKLDEYLSFYAEDFIRFDGKRIDEFRRMKRSVFRRATDKEIIFRDFDISPYPNENGENLYRVTFFEDYSASNYSFQGQKELYVRLNGEKMEIIIER